MGAEAVCTAEFDGQVSEGKALLETDYLLFRGSYRLKIPYTEIKSLAADDQRLTIKFAGGTAKFDLGKLAQKWLDKIQNPPSLLDKLGIKPNASVRTLQIHDETFLKDLKAAGTKSSKLSDIILVGIESREELTRIEGSMKSLAPKGAIWAVWPKGQKHITENEVINAARTAGLVDVKVARFSATHTAMKFVARRS